MQELCLFNLRAIPEIKWKSGVCFALEASTSKSELLYILMNIPSPASPPVSFWEYS